MAEIIEIATKGESLYRCGICKESFDRPEYAARCQAQGVPPLLFYCHDVLVLPGHNGRALSHELLVLQSHRVHHRTGVKCPVNGPCEHAVSYSCYRLVPAWLGGARAWLSHTDERMKWYASNGNYLKSYQRVATLADDCGGVLLEEADPARVLGGPYPQEEWAALWALHDQHTYRLARPMAPSLHQLTMWEDSWRLHVVVSQASRSRLEAVSQRLPNTPPYQFRHISPAHPTAHITNKPGRAGHVRFVCGLWIGSNSILAEDGAKLCTRCAGWLRARAQGGP